MFYVTYFPKYCINSMNMWRSYLCVCVCAQAHARSVMCDSATPWTIACQGPPSVGFSKQEHWSWLSFPAPEDLPDPEIQPLSLAPTALAGGFFTIAPHGEAYFYLALSWSAMSFLFILIQANFVLQSMRRLFISNSSVESLGVFPFPLMILHLLTTSTRLFACQCITLCLVTSVVSDPLWPHRPWRPRLLCPWDSPGKNTGVGCHFLLQW